MFNVITYSLVVDTTVVFIRMLAEETMTLHNVCPLIVQTGDDGLIKVSTEGRDVNKNPF